MSLRMMLSVHLAVVIFSLVTISPALGSCPDVPRAAWGARAPRERTNLTLPVGHVVVHHTYLPGACADALGCAAAMRSMQDMHQITNGWSDIGYNFCVGGDGQVYEGRGWDIVGAHAPKYNFLSVGICFIGDYRATAPSPAMLSAAKALIACGVARGSILPAYKLMGHSQVRHTECPGGALFAEIKTWPHWSSLIDIQPRRSVNATTPSSVANDVVVTSDAGVEATSSEATSTEATSTETSSTETSSTETSSTENSASNVSGGDPTTSFGPGIDDRRSIGTSSRVESTSVVDDIVEVWEATSEVAQNNTIDDAAPTD